MTHPAWVTYRGLTQSLHNDHGNVNYWGVSAVVNMTCISIFCDFFSYRLRSCLAHWKILNVY